MDSLAEPSTSSYHLANRYQGPLPSARSPHTQWPLNPPLVLQVPEKLRRRILRHFIDMHHITDGVDTHAFMHELPTHLRQEMASLLNDGIIGDLFSEIFSDCSPPFVVAILLRLELMVAVKGDILVRLPGQGASVSDCVHGRVRAHTDAS